MATKQIVDIKLHPLSWRVLREQYTYDGIAVDLGCGWLYNIVVQALRRHPVVTPWELKCKPEGMVDGRVYAMEYDCDRYGSYLRLSHQANISVVIYKMERERLCQQIALMHVVGGVSRDKAMRYFLDKAGYEEDEISFAALRKHYQRHYRHFEDAIAQDLKELRGEKTNKTEQ